MSENQSAVRPVREIRVVEDNSVLSYLFDSSRFEHLYRIAGAMAAASLIPEHLWKDKRGEFTPEQVKANCFLIVNQAIRWGMDPFSVMPETYVVSGKLGYQGKLVAAVINSRAGLAQRLNYTFSGTKGKDDFTVTVSGAFPNEEPRTITLSVGDAKTTNDMWRKDPEQKLVYSGATKWARRHCPEILLGVVTDDDIDRMNEASLKNVTPSAKDLVGEKIEFNKYKADEKSSQDQGERGATADAPRNEEKAAGEPTTSQVPDAGSTPAAPTNEPDIKTNLIRKIEKRVADEGLQLRYFISAVASIPSVNPSFKLLSELDTQVLDHIDNILDDLIEKAKAIQEKRSKKD